MLYMCQSPDRDRAVIAKKETWNQLKVELESMKIDVNTVQLYIRCFKHEEILEVWIRDPLTKLYTQFDSYPFCTNSGHLGPKRREGDKQIPEGVYHINRFNPKSKFYLSLGINYPNQADLIFADKINPGTDIFIHGKCSSVGCIAIGDAAIKRLYTLASASESIQSPIRVDIFPFKFNSNPNIDESLKYEYDSFWENLKAIYLDFEESKEITAIDVSKSGKYIVNRIK